jgi:hypothetical protein
MKACNAASQAKDAIANLTADNVTHIGRVQFLEQKFSVALKEREQVRLVLSEVGPQLEQPVTPANRLAVIWQRATSSGLRSSGWRLNASPARTCRYEFQITKHALFVTRLKEMDQCERRLQDARTARDGDRSEHAAAMAAANARNAELQKTLQQLQASSASKMHCHFAKSNLWVAGAAAAGGAGARQLQKRP